MNALALVIGNDEYSLTRHKLLNAVNDANSISDKLSRLGFEVIQSNNCNRVEFFNAASEFGNKLVGCDIGLFYFSGHGLQIEGFNYLTVIDTSFADAPSAKLTSCELTLIIEHMQAAKPAIKIIILDACRNNPWLSTYRGIYQTGLAPVFAPKGSLIAYSTSPGETAMDAGGDNHSIYTASFLDHIEDPNIPVEEFFKRVRTSVYDKSGGKQTSWEHTCLIGSFCFNSGQLVHSVTLPYTEEVVADENFMINGSASHAVIDELKSRTWERQNSALANLAHLPIKSLDNNYLFILGRNLLQTASGGSFEGKRIFENLATWLSKYQIKEESHVLNGILFEIYFNSKGQFRQNNFKAEFLTEIFTLRANRLFQRSFEFILSQLKPFERYLIYLPTVPSKKLALEITVEQEEYENFGKKVFRYKLNSVKHEGVELINNPLVDDDDGARIKLSKLRMDISQELVVPIGELRISFNLELSDEKNIVVPWPLRLLKKYN